MNEIIIYQTNDNQTHIEVNFDGDTVWLNRQQLAQLFDRDIKTIGKHINNVFTDNELDKHSTVAKFATVQKEGLRLIERSIDFYNLDVIISVGYRVKSQRGVQFRQWATSRLKDYLIKGFTINKSSIQQNKALFLKTIEDLKILTENTSLIEAGDLLSLIEGFSNTWFSLDKYDKSIFPTIGTKQELLVNASDLLHDIQLLKQDLIQKNEATELFAQEKQNGSVQGILGTIYQTIFGQDAYETIEEKAAHLLYFIVKNHPFNDGNKRSGAFAFIWYLRKAGISFESKINPAALTALTLLIAESNPSEKDKMVGIVLLLLGDKE
jgi:death-on-curing family protein